MLDEKNPCNLCGSWDTQLLYPSTLVDVASGDMDFRCTSATFGSHPDIVRCRVCGLVYVNPRWRTEVINNLYLTTEDPVYIEERDGRVKTFESHLNRLEAYLSTPKQVDKRHLDTGCHVGVMVELAQKRGWESWGIEPSSWAVEQAQSRGLKVLLGTLGTTDLPDNYFGLVTMFDVLEHFTDPIAELKHAHRILKSEGIIAIHTMNIDSPFARLMGKNWPWLMEMHLYFFSPHTLMKMLDESGFEVIHYETHGRFLSVGYLITRIKPYSRSIYNIFDFITSHLSLKKMLIPINLGDLFTIYARKI